MYPSEQLGAELVSALNQTTCLPFCRGFCAVVMQTLFVWTIVSCLDAHEFNTRDYSCAHEAKESSANLEGRRNVHSNSETHKDCTCAAFHVSRSEGAQWSPIDSYIYVCEQV